MQRGVTDGGDHWWRQIGKEKVVVKESERADTQHSNKALEKDKKQLNVPRYGSSAAQTQNNINVPKYDDPDKKPVKMTENLKALQNTRSKKIEEEVEDEFKALQERKQLEHK